MGDDTPKLTLGLYFCEIKMYNKSNGLILEVKRGVSDIDTSFHEWFANSVAVDFNGIEVKTLDIYHTILLLFAQAFINNECKVIFYKCRLSEYFDIAYFVYNNSEFDWHQLIELSEKRELTHQIHSVLKSVNEIYPLPVEFMESIFNQYLR